MRKRIIIFVTSMLFLTGSINVLEKSVYAQDELETISITYTDNLTITLHKITSLEINELKQEIGVYEEGKNYNVIINGSGTGLRPPTEQEWREIAEKGLIADNLVSTEFKTLPTRVDHMEEPWFPPIGNQYLKGSCTCFSIVYYIKTYQEAKEHGWDLSNAKWDFLRGPSKEYQDKIFSPDFVYHQINYGDDGSWPPHAMNLIHEMGVCTWKEMPYDSWDSTSWPSESAFREAPLYRSAIGCQWLRINSDTGINNLKNLLASGELATITVNAGYYWTGLILDNHWTVDDYHPSEVNHANTVVGYDDNYGPYIEEGERRYGAFKIVNSHGPLFSTYWISYEAMKQRVKYCWYFADKIDYEPQLLSVLQIDHPIRNDCDVTLGLNITEKDGFYLYTEPKTKTFSFSMAGSCPFPNNKIVLDITEFTAGISEIEGEKFFLKVYERGGVVYVLGTLTHFSVEYYDDYDSGIPTITAISEDPPIKTVGNGEVIAELVVPSSNVSLHTDKQTYSIGENVTITLENNEDEAIYFATSSHWSIQKDVNGNWGTICPGIVLPVITQLGSGEKEESIWNQKDADGARVGPGDYRVVTAYSINDLTFTKYAYFSIVGYSINPLAIFTDKSIYAPDEKVSISAQNIGTDALSLKKWYVEKETLSGTWETIYESPIFFDYFVVIPINETYTNYSIAYTNYTIMFPYNNTYWIIANTSIFENWTTIGKPDEPIIVLPNETVGIWSNNTLIIGNWTTIVPLVINQSNWIYITGSVNDNITDWTIETPVISWTNGWINYTVTNGDVGLDTQISTGSDIDLPVVTFDMFSTGDAIATNDDLISGKDFTFIEGDDIFNITPIDWPYGTPVTTLLPNQKLTWNWSQITSDDEKTDFGEYHIKVEYDDSYATSAPFLICMELEILEIYDQGGNDTIVERQDDGTYLIDGDADGHWDYTYNPTTGTTNPFIEKKESETSGKISWIIPGGIIVVLVVIAVVVYFYKKQRL